MGLGVFFRPSSERSGLLSSIGYYSGALLQPNTAKSFYRPSS